MSTSTYGTTKMWSVFKSWDTLSFMFIKILLLTLIILISLLFLLSKIVPKVLFHVFSCTVLAVSVLKWFKTLSFHGCFDFGDSSRLHSTRFGEWDGWGHCVIFLLAWLSCDDTQQQYSPFVKSHLVKTLRKRVLLKLLQKVVLMMGWVCSKWGVFWGRLMSMLLH